MSFVFNSCCGLSNVVAVHNICLHANLHIEQRHFGSSQSHHERTQILVSVFVHFANLLSDDNNHFVLLIVNFFISVVGHFSKTLSSPPFPTFVHCCGTFFVTKIVLISC